MSNSLHWDHAASEAKSCSSIPLFHFQMCDLDAPPIKQTENEVTKEEIYQLKTNTQNMKFSQK